MNPFVILIKKLFFNKSKIFKRIKRIITALIIIIVIVMLIIGIMFLLDILGITDIDDGNASDFGDSSTASASVEKLLESAKKIDEYMADKGYHYYQPGEGFDNKYDDGNSTATCCATYISWCLQDAGMIKDHFNYAGDIYSTLKSNSDWEEVNASDESDLKAGDICVYYNSAENPPYYHVNMYAGNSQFWDAGSDEAIKGKGTISHPLPTYVLRYKK